MNATELFHANGKSCGIYHCGQCRAVYALQGQAEMCCAPSVCSACGKETGRRYYTICSPCEAEKWAQKERERFERAEKVPAWDGWIFSEGLGYQDGFFEDWDDFNEWLASEFEPEDFEDNTPDYFWTCDSSPCCHLDYGSIIENATQDAYEDWEAGRLSGQEELKAAIDAFNEANKGEIGWAPNYKRALVLGPVTAPA